MSTSVESSSQFLLLCSYPLGFWDEKCRFFPSRRGLGLAVAFLFFSFFFFLLLRTFFGPIWIFLLDTLDPFGRFETKLVASGPSCLYLSSKKRKREKKTKAGTQTPL
jgi:hypothetical protein